MFQFFFTCNDSPLGAIENGSGRWIDSLAAGFRKNRDSKTVNKFYCENIYK